MDWKARLTEDRSLVQVYWKARTVASSRWNMRVSVLFAFILLIGLIASAHCGGSSLTSSALVLGIREIADVGFNFTVAILGFLIAGFAIFSSVTKPEVFILLAKLDHRDTNISRLQFMFFNFLLVFIHFIFFLAVTMFVKVLLYPNGPLTDGARYIMSLVPTWKIYTEILVFSLFSGWLVFLLMLLKSFIWNLYQAVLVSIGVEAELKD